MLGDRYEIAATAEGAASFDPVFGTAGQADAVQVVVEAVYAARVTLSDPSGERPCTNPKLFGKPSHWRSVDSRARSVSRADSRLQLAFAGVEGIVAAASSAGRYSKLLLFRGGTDAETIGVQYFVDLPGYEPVAADLQVPRATKRLPDYDLRLEPSMTSFGTLTLELVGNATVLPLSPCEPQFAGLLRLYQEDSDLSYSIALDYPCSPSTLPGIPTGSYLARFEIGDGKVPYPKDGGVEVHVSPAAVANLAIRLDGLGAAQVVVMRAANRIYDGKAGFRLDRVPDGTMIYKMFDCGPYVFIGLPPGEYSIELVRAPGLPAGSDGAGVVTVSRDALAVAEIFL